MTDLVVRRLLIDLQAPFARRWNGGDAFRSAIFNALSMSFPVGEQFFIDAVRLGMKSLPDAERARLEPEVQGFIGQEATHRRLHALYNAQLQTQGLRNTWGPRSARRVAAMASFDPRHAVAVTAATEHLTAILADWMLGRPATFEGAEPRLATLWLWHSAEESEHRATAFDLYVALGGDHAWRVRWLRLVTRQFVVDLARQTLRNLWDDGALFDGRTWRSAVRFLFGRDGLVTVTRPAWRAYLAPDFHPHQQPAERSAQWLREHAAQYAVVGVATVNA
ncbi:MAG: metal-dependent hydrolase [Burkholderiaceae bacterium]